MALSDKIEELAKKHGATSYRNRADTQHPAYGFTPAQLLNLLAEFTAEISKQDEALIRQMLEALELARRLVLVGGASTHDEIDAMFTAASAARARLEKTDGLKT